MGSRVISQTIAFFKIGPWAWRSLVVLGTICWGGPYMLHLVEPKVPRQQRLELLNYVATRGPWVGTRTATGGYTHADGPPDYTFQPGDVIVWESETHVVRGTVVSGEFTLWCNGRPIASNDHHIYADQLRDGWGMNGLEVPNGAPPAECGVRRHAEAFGAHGEHQVKDDYPVINARIIAK